MIPSILVSQVRRGLEDLLRSTLDLSTPAFRGIVDRFVANPEAFIKGPWISIELPFRKADPARGEFFPDIPLGFIPHAHQAKAFDRLVYPNARSTLVATGTGSGKTECFLWPIFDACTKLKGAPGIRAIIIYPMNALAGDQARRIAKAITEIPALSGVRCGIYADSEPRPASAVVTPIEVITSREEMRRNPPDILLTNYKMLDFLLVRSQDRPLWAMNDPTTLRYLVVDEIHTFDGAQGTDLALLIRRLKARLRTPEGHLACVGTSATLGGPGAAEELIAYAEDIFGERFDAGAIVTEDRQSVTEYLGAISVDDIRIPDVTALASLLGKIDAMDQAGAARAIADLIVADPPSGESTSDPWRIALGTKLKGHILFHEVLRTTGGKPARLDTISDELGRRAFLSNVDATGRAVVVEALTALVSYSRAGAPGNTRALLNVRLQLWLRELARMVATAPRRLDSADPTSALSDLAHSDDLDSAATRRALPLTYCRHCGTGGLLASRPEGTRTSYWATPKSLYEGFFEGSTSLRILYPERVETRGRAGGNSVEGTLCPDCLSIKAEACRSDSVCSCGYGSSPGVPIWVYDPPRLAAPSGGAGARIDKSCPACGTENALAIAGVRAATEASSLAATLFGSTQNDDPKLLLFSDSVQDAAQRAAVIESRNLAVVLRKALVQHLDVQTGRKTTLADLIANAPTMFRATLGDASFVSTFIPGDMTWMRDFEALILTDALPDSSHLPDNVAYRSGWEIFSETTYRSRTSQTLESGGLAAAAVMPDLIKAIARDLVARWEDKIGTVVSAPSQKAATRFVAGVLDTMRRKGAVAHEYLERAVERANDRGPNWFAARRSLVRNVLPDVMPIPRASSSSSPRLPTTRARLDGFEAVGRDGASNWYRSWADKFFQTRYAFGASIIEDVFALLFECAGTHGVVKRLLAGADPNKPVEALTCGAIEVDRNAVHVVCDACGRRHLVPETAAVIWQSAPCTKAACQGTFSLDSAEAASVYLDRLLSQGRNKRIVAREHTGILEAADRRRLETRFISGKKDWDPNVISATPTLEMGINIGDLSSLLLCSIPPEQANYLQRIGRTGRRDGNSLNLTIANARPHDLLYWADPGAMIAGSVRPPGVHLEAFAVLKRQIAAFSLDLMVAWSVSPVDYGRMKDAFEAIGGGRPMSSR
jgi:DEAD/DEAH box helicase domain-containing protein